MISIVLQNNTILSFLYDFDLLLGESYFNAEIDFVLHNKRKIAEGQVRVSFDENDNHAIITIFNPKWNESILPAVLDSKLYTFNYIPGIALQVNGIHANPLIGIFKVSIFPKK